MATLLWADATYGTLAASVGSGTTSASVNMIQGSFPVPVGNQQFSAVFNPNLSGLPDHVTTERVIVTANSNGQLTLAASVVNNHFPGEYVIAVIDAAALSGLQGFPTVNAFLQSDFPINNTSTTTVIGNCSVFLSPGAWLLLGQALFNQGPGDIDIAIQPDGDPGAADSVCSTTCAEGANEVTCFGSMAGFILVTNPLGQQYDLVCWTNTPGFTALQYSELNSFNNATGITAISLASG